MDIPLILTGKVETEQGLVESYQILIDCNYRYRDYDPSSDRELFFEETSTYFACLILDQRQKYEFKVFSGMRINPQTGKHEKIQKLEENVLFQFKELMIKNGIKLGLNPPLDYPSLLS